LREMAFFFRFTIVNFPYFLCFHYTGCVCRLGGRGSHIMMGTLGGTVVGLFAYIGMIYHPINEVTKNKHWLPPHSPTSHKCQDRHQESVMCGSALPPADHERTNGQPDRRIAITLIQSAIPLHVCISFSCNRGCQARCVTQAGVSSPANYVHRHSAHIPTSLPLTTQYLQPDGSLFFVHCIALHCGGNDCHIRFACFANVPTGTHILVS